MLDEKQKTEVAAWFAAGASLDEIQKRIDSGFGIHMTYLDVRLLVSELPQPKEPDPAPDAGEAPVAATGPDAQNDPGDFFDDEPPPADGEAPASDADSSSPEDPNPEGQSSEGKSPEGQTAFGLSIDTITIPGTLASGDVTFSDGAKGKWYVDGMGRMGLGGDLPPGYRPSPQDAALFQTQLVQLLQSRGLC